MRMTRVLGAVALVLTVLALTPSASQAASSPTVTAVSPTTGVNNGPATLAVTGTGFVSGAKVSLEKTVNGTATVLGPVSATFVDAAHLTNAQFDLTNQAPGAWGVRVTNPDNGTGALANGFTVTASGAPTFTSITPNTAPANTTQTVTIAGSHFFKGTSVAFTDSDDTQLGDVPPNNITTETPTLNQDGTLSVVIHIPNNAKTEAQTLTISNTDGQAVTKTGAFTVTTAVTGPTVTKISPTPQPNTGTSAAETICGTGFSADSSGTATVSAQLEKTIGGTPYVIPMGGTFHVTKAPAQGPAQDCQSPQADEITGGTFDLTFAPPGPWTLRVTNGDKGTGTLANGFTVAGTQPVVSSIDPAKASQGDPAQAETIKGDHFAKGDAVTLSNNSNGGIKVSDVSTTVTGTDAGKAITATFTVGSNATPGNHDVIVTHSDGQSGTLGSGFQVATTSPHAFDYVAYDPNFLGGVSVAGGNLVVGGAGDEIVTGAGPGGGPNVIVARPNLSGSGATVVSSFFAYDPGFHGGVRVAVGEFDGNAADGAELVTAPGPGGGPNVRIWKIAANGAVTQLASFMAYDPGFTGGVNVAAGNVSNSGTNDQLITGAGVGGGPHVRVFTVGNAGAVSGSNGFFAYNPAFTGGVSVAVGDLGGTLHRVIITGAGPGGGPDVELFDSVGSRIAGFFAYDAAFTGGVSVAAGNVTGSNPNDEIITGAGPGGGPDIEIWGTQPLANLHKGFYAFGQAGFPGGVRVAAADVDGDGTAEIVDGPWSAATSIIEGTRLAQ